MENVKEIGKKGVSIAILGLENAGKTTFVQRLRKGVFVENTVPTAGFNFEVVKYGDFMFKIFDVGGQKLFRERLWLNYINYSYGIIFIFDASDPSGVKDAKEWFWYIVNNIAIERRTVIMFLANKADLKSMSIEEIIDSLELEKMFHYPKASFRIFKTSNKTGENIDEAMKWYIKKLKQLFEEKQVHPKALLISSKNGVTELFLDFEDFSVHQENVSKFLSLLLYITSRFLADQRISSLSTESFKFVVEKKNDRFVTLICDQEDSRIEAQRYIELIHAFLENQTLEKKQQFIYYVAELFDLTPEQKQRIKEVEIKED